MGIIDKIKITKLKSSKNKDQSKYLEMQYQRSKLKLKQKNDIEPKRKEFLINLLSSKINLSKIEKSLILGCRNAYELDLLENKGVKETIGVDLFSNDKRVLVMDMHNLEFSDNTFDLVYCSHVLEHALDYDRVLSEIFRVMKNNSIITIEIPVNFKLTEADLHDFKDSSNFVAIIKKHTLIREIIFAEDIAKNSESNFCGTDAVRLIIKIEKEK
jgi:SAM-dependent methyltransferase